MCTTTLTPPVSFGQKDPLRITSTQQQITTAAVKRDITMHRGECSVYGCYCKEYVGANVGTCENCGHHYDSHRY